MKVDVITLVVDILSTNGLWHRHETKRLFIIYIWDFALCGK